MPVKSRRAGAGSSATQRIAPAGKADPKSDQLRKMSKKLGNTQVQAVIGANNQQRDAIYQFIVARLQRVRSVQNKELAAMQNHRVWFDEVARKKTGFALPDPTRWRTVARHYRMAAQSLARGNIGQAVQHLDRAMHAEKAAFASLPAQVNLDHTFDNDTRSPTAQVHAGDGCTPREVTEAVQIAEQIERVAALSEPEGLPRSRKPWWGTEESEDDEEKKKNGDKNGDKNGSKNTNEAGENKKTEPTDAAQREERVEEPLKDKEPVKDKDQAPEHAEPEVSLSPPSTTSRTKKPKGKPPA